MLRKVSSGNVLVNGVLGDCTFYRDEASHDAILSIITGDDDERISINLQNHVNLITKEDGKEFIKSMRVIDEAMAAGRSCEKVLQMLVSVSSAKDDAEKTISEKILHHALVFLAFSLSIQKTIAGEDDL